MKTKLLFVLTLIAQSFLSAQTQVPSKKPQVSTTDIFRIGTFASGSQVTLEDLKQQTSFSTVNPDAGFKLISWDVTMNVKSTAYAITGKDLKFSEQLIKAFSMAKTGSKIFVDFKYSDAKGSIYKSPSYFIKIK